jgi:hypothetical protein
MKVELIGMYVPPQDITFIMKDTFNDDGELLTAEVTGFYHGEPTHEDNKLYNGKPKAEYDV